MTSAEKFRALTCTQTLRANLGARSVRAAAFTAAAGFGDFAIRIGSTAILARLILPEHFGLIMMTGAVIAVADQLRELGLSSATVQQPEITHAQVTNLFWINAAAGTALAGLVALGAPWIAAFYDEPRLGPVTVALASTLLLGGLGVQHQALLTRQLKLGRAASVRLASSVLSTALAIALAWWGFGYWALLWREIARAALLAIGMWWSFPWVPGLPAWDTDVRPLLRYGGHLTGGNLFASITAGIDRFLLGRIWGADAVGVYRQSFQLVAAPTDQLLSPLYQVSQPSLSLLQNDPPRFRQFYLKLLALVCALTMPFSLFVAVYADIITGWMLGPAWMAAAPIMCILSFSTFAKQAVGSTAFVLITRGRSKAYLGLTVLHNVVLVVAMCVGVRWGGPGIALAEVATTYMLIAPRLHYGLRGSPIAIGTFLAALLRPVLASLVMGYALLAWREGNAESSSAAALGIGAVLAAFVFWGTWLLLPGGKAELRAIGAHVRTALLRKTAPTSPPEAAVQAT